MNSQRTNARQRRCNGRLPCHRCASQKEECSYQDRVWRTKDDLRAEIAKLQDVTAQVLSLVERVSIAQGSSKFEPEVVQRLRQSTVFDNIMRTLGIDNIVSEHGISMNSNSNGESATLASSNLEHWATEDPEQSCGERFASISDATPTSSIPSTQSNMLSGIYASNGSQVTRPSSVGSPFTSLLVPTIGQLWPSSNDSNAHVSPPMATAMLAGTDRPAVDGRSTPPPTPQQVMNVQWTFPVIDSGEMNNAISIYLEWEPLGYSVICKETFLKDISTQRRRFCSEALTCAVMARAYQMMKCAGQDISEQQITVLYSQAQTLLIMERSMLETEFPYIQTLTILASIDIVNGQLEHAWVMAFEAARLAILDALHNIKRPSVNKEHLLVRANTFCGAISLARLLRLFMMRIEPMEAPLFMRLGLNMVETPEGRIERGKKVNKKTPHVIAAPDTVDTGFLLQTHFLELLKWCPFRTRFSWEVIQHTHAFMMFHFDESTVSKNKADLFEVYPMLQKCWEQWTMEPGNSELSPGKLYN
ncbi:hypothetical protein S7711_10032 [Stachybotrys chartarum IBT 7711]|uniref:Zn(2)-C6 fungal-type domain-containing protein n=1 Tax=Stachybotrys chartarum (strain CBS 109288 / IBT 7711) TaxID=1280523 RepID=A0A084BAB5_STACB|nr:hypothetical protein S7711_10032 [Stachybotrys chartarum IBT 7711]